MKERPINLKAHEVLGILEGRQTQLRRVVKPQPEYRENSAVPGSFGTFYHGWNLDHKAVSSTDYQKHCPFGVPSDRLWVRENVIQDSTPMGPIFSYGADCKSLKSPIGYSYMGGINRTIPSIHMPRWASRITLEVTGVRVERLQDISEEDARAEGIIDGGCLSCGGDEPCGCRYPHPDPVDAFIHLWESINGPGSWAANPWLWVIEFKKVDQ